MPAGNGRILRLGYPFAVQQKNEMIALSDYAQIYVVTVQVGRFGPPDKRAGDMVVYRVKAKITLAGNKGKVIRSLLRDTEHYTGGAIPPMTVKTKAGLDNLIHIHAVYRLKPCYAVFLFQAEEQRAFFEVGIIGNFWFNIKAGFFRFGKIGNPLFFHPFDRLTPPSEFIRKNMEGAFDEDRHT
jgi:hypothetical protein